MAHSGYVKTRERAGQLLRRRYERMAITVSVADAPRPDEILVVMAIADGGRLRNRCGTEPIR